MQLKDIFVQNLRKYRRDRGISQAVLAELCDTSTSYIGQMEIGNRFPSIEMIEKIAKALQISPHSLFFSETDGNTTEKTQQKKPIQMSDTTKDELIVRLNAAIRTIIKRMN